MSKSEKLYKTWLNYNQEIEVLEAELVGKNIMKFEGGLFELSETSEGGFVVVHSQRGETNKINSVMSESFWQESAEKALSQHKENRRRGLLSSIEQVKKHLKALIEELNSLG